MTEPHPRRDERPAAMVAPHPPAMPAERAPRGACDTHIHMVAAPGEMPLWDGRVEDPAPGLALADYLARYRALQATLGTSRTVVVQSILYGADNRLCLDAVEHLGRTATRAVCIAPDAAPDAVLDDLAARGAAAVRLNYVHGGLLTWDGAQEMAPRLAARGMHLQMLVHAGRHLETIAPVVRSLPVPVVFDHLAWPDVAQGPDEAGFRALLALVAEGAAYVKLSGIYRLARAPWEATDPFVAALVAANPERCLWGTDWPHLMLADAAMPDAGRLLDAFHRVVTNDEHRRRILVDNPAALYRF